jgi:hypothetical protein
VALGTAAALTAAGWGLLLRQEKLLHEVVINEAMYYASKNHEDRINLNDSESLALCRTIPNKDTSGYKGLTVFELTPQELEFYVWYKRAYDMNDAVGRSMMNDLRSEWEGGKFKCTLLHPDVPFLYREIGNSYFVR